MSNRNEYGISTNVPLSPSDSPDEEKKDQFGFTTDTSRVEHHPTLNDAHHSVGLAVIEQKSTIPQTGERKVTSKSEYWWYIIWCASQHTSFPAAQH